MQEAGLPIDSPRMSPTLVLAEARKSLTVRSFLGGVKAALSSMRSPSASSTFSRQRPFEKLRSATAGTTVKHYIEIGLLYFEFVGY